VWVNKLIVFLSVVVFLITSVQNSAFAREIVVDANSSSADFRSIQEAVNNSSSGDVILIYPGFYNESVDLGIQNISILSDSENPDDTIIRALKLSANNITVSGLSIRENLVLKGRPTDEVSHGKIENCTVKNNILESGIYANECYNSTIEKNVILNSGIYVYGPWADSSFTVSDNLIVNEGIDVHHGSYNCILSNNTLLNGGIGVVEGPGCKILGNYISNRIDDGYGIVLFESSSDIENNTIINCSEGISLIRLTGSNIVQNNTLKSNDRGIYVGNSGGNSFLNNTISKNNIGILVGDLTTEHAGANSLLNNTISNNNIGISFEGDSSGNTVINNKVELNKQYGVYINQFREAPYDGTNRFYNNIFNNTINFFNDTGNYTGNYYIAKATNISAGKISVALNTTKTSETNIVDGPYLGGNFWAKPDGTGFSQSCNDWNRDGIGDSVYTASAYDVDSLPLVSISRDQQPAFPIADFSVNVTGGYVPLSVQFIDFSQNATSRIWDFDSDGVADSTDKTPVYVYPISGTYTVNLTVSNANGTSSRLYPVTASNRPQYNLTETQITTNKSNQTMPAIYGDKIIFLDDRNGWRHYDIYMYDLFTSKETQITTNSLYYAPNTKLAIYGDKIVWADYRNEKKDLYMYNLSTNKEIQITNSGKAEDPAIYEDKIVYTDVRDVRDIRNGNADIYMYDLSTSKETQITTNVSWQGSPAIYGDRIVWQDYRNGNNTSSKTDIYMYNLSTSAETRVTTSGLASNPEIYGDRLVYMNGSQIYMYDLFTSKETKITAYESIQFSPAIYGDRIIWVDYRNRNNDVYMYNLSTHTETQITSNKSGQSSPAIYGDKIVWMDSRKYTDVFPYANLDIYICNISKIDPLLKTPVADFFANITSGNAPLKVLFTDNSTGAPNFWHWDFGDDVKSKRALNATHTFTEPGEYDVSLTVTNENGSNTRIMPKYITVSKNK
jgi:beta propeller repeat protein/parallel beta-helix repeat protein